MNVAQNIERGCRLHPERTAVLFEGDEISYRELNASSNRAANSLQELGVGHGDRVALCLPNIPEFISTYLGVLKIGAIAVSVNSSLTAGEIGAALADCGAAVLVTTAAQPDPRRSTPGGLPQLRHILAVDAPQGQAASFDQQLAKASSKAAAIEVNRDTPAAIVYTSGTTGGAKGVVLSHGNVAFTMEAKKNYLGIRSDDRLLLFLPMFHCFGQNAILNAALHAGAMIVLQRGFEADAVLNSIARDGVTMFFGVPTTFVLLGERATPDDFRGIRYFFSAAAPLPLEVENHWRKRFSAVIYQGYGLTETSPFASYNHSTQHKPGSVGAAIDGVEMRVVDIETGRPVPPGQTGEIVVRGPNVMLGYWNRPDETRQAVRNGWLHTGDIGRMDDEGYFVVEDRLKDMVIVGGFNVYPAEIENVLYQHRAIAEAAVFGVPDSVLGERLQAAVVLKAAVLKNGTAPRAEELLRHCRERLAAFKIPAEFDLVDQLPKSKTGKVLKRVLREQYAGDARNDRDTHRNGVVAAQNPESADDVETLQRRIVFWLAENLATDARQIDIHRPFADYGLTSVQAVQLARDLEDWLDRPVVPTITWHFSTVASLAGNVLTKQGASSWDESIGQLEAQVSGLSEDEAEAMLLEEVAKVHGHAMRGEG